MRLLFFLILNFSLLSCQVSPKNQSVLPMAPEVYKKATQPWKASSVVHSKNMVVTPHPLATAAAIEVLNEGGSAVEAALAAQVMLTLVEPAASGIGGGAFMLVYDPITKKITSFDARETAPASAFAEMFLDEQKKPMDFFVASLGGRSVGIPGFVKLAEVTHKKYGKKPWSLIWRPTIQASRKGFPISERLASHIQNEKQYLEKIPATKKYFLSPDGTPWPSGHLLKNLELAQTLESLSKSGAKEFYQGALSRKIQKTVATSPHLSAVITAEDMAKYKVIERNPVCSDWNWQQKNKIICSMGPPSSGGILVLQTFKILEVLLKKDSLKPPLDLQQNADFAHYYLEAQKLSYADRNKYIADPDFTQIPMLNLLSPEFISMRAQSIHKDKVINAIAPPGALSGSERWAYHSDYEPLSTSHISVVDSQGQAVSLTASIEHIFGSKLFVGGFLLNNQLTDFSFIPQKEGLPVANRVEPGKRPRSSMAPTLVLDSQQNIYAVIGSPGGSRIPTFIAKTLAQHLYGNQSWAEAVASPHIMNLNSGAVEVEDQLVNAKVRSALEQKGHTIRENTHTSGVNAIGVIENPEKSGSRLWLGTPDPRREGTAQGTGQ